MNREERATVPVMPLRRPCRFDSLASGADHQRNRAEVLV